MGRRGPHAGRVQRQRQVPADQRLQDRRERDRHAATAQAQTGTTITTPGTRIQSITLDDGTKIVENGAVVAGAPNVNLATTNFTANNGDSYPFNGAARSLLAQIPYQQSLFDFIKHGPGRRRHRRASTRSAAPAASRSAP